MSHPTSEDIIRRVKLVLVGDGGCGKSSLVTTYVSGDFPEVYHHLTFSHYPSMVYQAYVRTVCDVCTINIDVDGKQIESSLWDTAGQQDYACLRLLTYTSCDAVMICFAIDSPVSLQNVQENWIEEVLHYCTGVPILLVGCKMDLRNDPESIDKLEKIGRTHVTLEEGMSVAQKIGATHYLETSSKRGTGVHEVFERAAREAFRYHVGKEKKRRRGICTIV